MTALQGRTVLVTGANRGLGRALVDEALALDSTDPAQVDAAVAAVPDLDVLVNSAAGPVDTDMVRGLDLPRSSPASVARGTVVALERDEDDEDDIFPDPASAPA